MLDINLIKTGDANINLPKKTSTSIANFSFATIPGTGAAAGFRFFPGSLDSNLLDWSIDLRFVNGSDSIVIINQVNCEFRGKRLYLSKSRESVFIKEEVTGTSSDRYFPLMIPVGSEKVFHFDFILEIYRKYLFFARMATFKQSEILAPKTYMDLIQEVRIFVHIQGQTHPLVLKF